ncbi:MAG TPA: D-alanyl-D-alanine carboxypeptidase family protein [Candidatus Saccharimonadales bacterium]|nr:D-alanyl-D-alanine carboxypeptidase family protein [Candidatus Saccharimonadales bacterium]
MDRLCRRIRRASCWCIILLLAAALTAGSASARRHHHAKSKSHAHSTRHRHSSAHRVKSRRTSLQAAPAAGPGGTQLAGAKRHRHVSRAYASRRLRRHRRGRELAFLGFDSTGQPRLRSRAAIVYDPDSDRVLYAKNPDQRLPIASLTKIMTALVLLETQPEWDSVVAMTREDIHDASRTRLRAGERIRKRDLLQLALMVSDNAATRALVRTSGIAHDEFLARMNARARALGMTGTRFEEETGLDPGNVSSVRDYARLMAAACKYPLVAEVTSTPHYEFRTSRGAHVLANTDRLLYGNYDVMGGKTGFINEAGYCFATVVRAAGRQLVSVVLGAPTKGTRFLETARLIDWAGAVSQPLQARSGN